MAKNDIFLFKGYSRRNLDICTMWKYTGALSLMEFPEMYGGETFKQGRKNVVRMLVGILNKNDLHNVIFTYNKDRQQI